MVYRFDFEAKVASGVSAYSGLAGLVGAIVGGAIASRSKVKYVIVPAELTSCVCMLAVCLLKNPSLGLLTVIVSVYGFCNAAQSSNNISLLYKQEGMSPKIMACGLSLVMFMFRLSSYLTAQIFGVVYPSIGMDKAMLIWSIPVFVGALLVCTIKEPKFNEVKKSV